MAVVATGYFDGVHLGHCQVIKTLVSSARETGGEAVVITFAHHPRAVLQQDARSLRLLTSTSEKVALLKALGVDRVEVLPFTREFAALSAEEYIRHVLVERYACDTLVIGYDTRIGCDLCGAGELASMVEAMGIRAVRCPAVEGISSTRIRASLESGEVERAAAMLGRRHELFGVVVEGNRLGRSLGFPTANMQLYDPLKMVPANGVYSVEVEVLGRSFRGMTNVGTRPTVTDRGARTIETNIFDFDEDIYGLDIKVRFISRIRDERKFDSLAALRGQLAADKEECLSRLVRESE